MEVDMRVFTSVRVSASQVVLSVVLLAASAAWATAQTAPASVFVSVNAGLAQPADSTFSTTKVVSDPDGSSEYNAKYSLGNAGTLDIGGGVVLANRYTAGVSVSTYSSSAPATTTLSFKHPRVHPTITGSLETGDLERSETAVHLSLGYKLPTRGRFELVAFGGPSRFSVKQEFVSDLNAGERFSGATRTWSAYIDGYESSRSTGAGWGFHVGANAGVRVARRFSLVGTARYARASVDLEEPVLTMIEDRTVNTSVKVGGLQVMAGIRLLL